MLCLITALVKPFHWVWDIYNTNFHKNNLTTTFKNLNVEKPILYNHRYIYLLHNFHYIMKAKTQLSNSSSNFFIYILYIWPHLRQGPNFHYKQ